MDLVSTFGLLPFSRREALALGVTKRQFDAAVAAKELVRLRRGIYICQEAQDDRTRYAQKVAAELKGRANHLACSTSALALLDLPNPYFRSWTRLQVTTAGPRSNSRRGLRQNLGWAPINTTWGPCTDAIDTAVSIASELELPQALMVTDAVARLLAGVKPDTHLTTAKRIELASEPCRTEVRRRLMRSHDLPALRLANPAAESPAESFYRGLMILDGYEDPACGVPRRGLSMSQYFIDILLPGLAIEVDGEMKYNNPAELAYEKRREDDLRATGLVFHRAVASDVYADHLAAMHELREKRALAEVIHRLFPTLG